MNNSVLKSGATTALAIVGGYVAGKGWVTSDQWAQLSPLLLAIGVGVWKMLDHTAAASAVAADKIPGVTVTVDPAKAPNAVLEAALAPSNDIKVTK